jgi:hypothetical protein
LSALGALALVAAAMLAGSSGTPAGAATIRTEAESLAGGGWVSEADGAASAGYALKAFATPRTVTVTVTAGTTANISYSCYRDGGDRRLSFALDAGTAVVCGAAGAAGYPVVAGPTGIAAGTHTLVVTKTGSADAWWDYYELVETTIATTTTTAAPTTTTTTVPPTTTTTAPTTTTTGAVGYGTTLVAFNDQDPTNVGIVAIVGFSGGTIAAFGLLHVIRHYRSA